MALDRNTMLCLALVAIGGIAVGVILFDSFYKEEVTIKYSVMESTPQSGEFVAVYFFDMSDAPDGTVIYYKGASDNWWSKSTYHSYNDALLKIRNMEPIRSDALSMDFYGEADGYKFKFVCMSSP